MKMGYRAGHHARRKMNHKNLSFHMHLGIALIGIGIISIFAGCETLTTDTVSQTINAAARMGSEKSSTEKIVAGLKEALRVGTKNAVQQTSREGGYGDNPQRRIAMPEELQKMAEVLRKSGFSKQVDTFESKMNRAAEQAAAEAGPVFLDAVQDMSFSDAKQILNGKETAATDYFRAETSDMLEEKFGPAVKDKMNQLGVVRLFKEMQKRYNQVPMVPETNYNIKNYVVDEALEGLFSTLADEEKKIRQNPKARTTALLREVFGSGGK